MAQDRDEKRTLTEEDIVDEGTREDVGRRKAMNLVGAGAAAGAVVLATGCGGGYRRRGRIVVASAGYTDGDRGRCADPGGGGRGPQMRGVTDADGGPCADPGGYGRSGGGGGGSGITDSDCGAGADPGGNGRGYTNRTDNDYGNCADPAGRGRF